MYLLSIPAFLSFSAIFHIIKNPEQKVQGGNPIRYTVNKKNSEIYKIFQSKSFNTVIPYSHFFFHPDYTVGLGISPNHALRLVGFTTGGESHPALKNLFN